MPVQPSWESSFEAKFRTGAALPPGFIGQREGVDSFRKKETWSIEIT